MTDQAHIEPSRLPVTFTVDGQSFSTGDFADGKERQQASEILRLAGLDPNAYDLGEIQGKDKPVSTKRFSAADLIDIEKGARFVSIRQKADVALMQDGVQGFVNRMAELDCEPYAEGELVICLVTPVGGAHDGCPVKTGVGVDELASWPMVPPHFIHLPDNIRFPRPHHSLSPKPGWLMHSRGIPGWGKAAPGVDWVSHVRAVICEAIA